MKTRKTLVVMTAVAVLTAVMTPQIALATEFLPFEGKNAVQEGEGGTKKVIEGVDFWANGEPPRKYQLLGFVEDTRHKSGLIGKISMSSLETDVAATAKKAGGDAVILVAAEAEIVGAVRNSFGGGQANVSAFGNSARVNGSGWNTGISSAVKKQHSRYAVVKYLPDQLSRSQHDDSATGAAPTPKPGE